MLQFINYNYPNLGQLVGDMHHVLKIFFKTIEISL